MSALLISPTKGQRKIYIASYQTALSSNLTQNTMRLGRNNISIKVVQQAFNFIVRCTTPEYKTDLQNFIRIAMRETMRGDSGLKPMRLLWPSQRIDYLGYITVNQMGVQKFEVGPTLSFSLQLAKDELNTITNDFSTGGDYTGIYDGQVYTEDDFTIPEDDYERYDQNAPDPPPAENQFTGH